MPTAYDALLIITGFSRHAIKLAERLPHTQLAPKPSATSKAGRKGKSSAARATGRGQKRKLAVDAESSASSGRPSKSRKVAESASVSSISVASKKTRGRPSKAAKTAAASNEAPIALTSSDAATSVSVASKSRNHYVNPRPTERMATRSASAVKIETSST